MVGATFLEVDIRTLEVRPGGPATAGIWLVTGSGAFPEVGWNDFVVVVLSWWAKALLESVRGSGVRRQVPFMEGPHSVAFTVSSGKLHYTLISSDREVGAGGAELTPFVIAMISSSGEVLDACKSRDWWSTDAEILESLLADLKWEIAKS